MAQVSDGTCFENPRALKRALTKLKRMQRVVSRRQKGSANRKKAVQATGKGTFPGGQYSQGCTTSGNHMAGENQVGDRVGEPECERDDEKSPPGASDCGCGHV